MPNFTPDFKGYSGQGAFRFWCQSVLPLVYDDSLSYMELLNKVVVYLNNTISDVAAMEENVDALLNSYVQLQQYVNDYFDNLDVQDEINNKLDGLVEDGTMDELLEPFVTAQIPGLVESGLPGVVEDQIDEVVADQIDDVVGEQISGVVAEQIPEQVTDWLEDNVTPVGSAVIVDSGLTISGAAADAKVTGTKIESLKENLFEYNSAELIDEYGERNDRTSNGVSIAWNGHNFTLSGTATANPNFNVINTGDAPEHIRPGDTVYVNFSSTASNAILQIIAYSTETTSQNYSFSSPQLFTIPSDTIRIIVRIRGTSNSATYDATGTAELLTAMPNKVIYDTLSSEISKRIYAKNAGIYAQGSEITLADIVEDGYYIISDEFTITDAPEGFRPTGLKVEKYSIFNRNVFIKQTIESVTRASTTSYIRFSNSSEVFGDWVNLTPINVPVTEDAVLDPTGDMTDRSTEIVALLNTNGICKLGNGVYYVSGFTMPQDTEIVGIGNGTVVRLLDSVTSGSVIDAGYRCKIKDIRFVGSDNRQGGDDTIGTRNGVFFSHEQGENDLMLEISGCSFIGFSGAGIRVLTTGYYMLNSICVSDCYFRFNKVGIYMAEKAEYSVINNCIFRRNYFGVINNGGNNKFSNCGFDGNTKGFVIDGTGITSSNNGHGSVVGSSFNHNTAFGIYIKTCPHGFLFDGCNIFNNTDADDLDHSIAIISSRGITFNGCLLSGISATSESSNGSQMNNCRFSVNPDIGTGITLNNCSLTDGTVLS